MNIFTKIKYKRFLKILFKEFIVPLFRAIASLGFDKNYLKGRYFDESLVGWFWVLRAILIQKILGFNRNVRWPISPSTAVDEPEFLDFHPDDLQNFMHHGCYFSNVGGGKIVLEKGVVIAPNVGIVTTNHDFLDPTKHCSPRDVLVGKNSWLGMNSVILPGTVLGEHTIVAAGAVVTKSYPDGWCVLAGSPAKVLKKIHRNEA